MQSRGEKEKMVAEKKEPDPIEVARKIAAEHAGVIHFIKSPVPCFGVTFINDPKVAERTKLRLEAHTKRMAWFWIPTLIVLLIPTVLLAGFGIVAGSPYFALLPLCAFVIGAVYLLLYLRKEYTTRREVEKVSESLPEIKEKYILIYYGLPTLIHELLHIKKGHLEEEKPKINRMAEDYVVEMETRKLLKALRKK